MISTKTLLRCLAVIVSIDIITTTVDVGFRGAIELNPLAHILGFWGFMISKVIISVWAIHILYGHISKNHPEARVAIYVFLVVYGATFVFNTAQNVTQIMGWTV